MNDEPARAISSRRVTDDRSTNARPPIKSAGGKTKLLPELLARVPLSFRGYHEPFVGGGALFWALAAQGDRRQMLSTKLFPSAPIFATHLARLTDTNEPLILVYQALQDGLVENVIKTLHRMPNTKEFFLETRERFSDAIQASPLGRGQIADDVRIAAMFIYLNKSCFNGLYRVNQSGRFNVPFGGYDRPLSVTKIDEANLRACATVLNAHKTEIEAASFESILDYAKKDDFAFFDPPYLPVSKTSNFATYSKDVFRLADHERLRDVLLELKRRGVHVLLSNSDSEITRDLYSDPCFRGEAIQAPRSINSVGSKRGNVSELVVR